MLIQGPSGAKDLVKTRCERGADIARDLGFSQASAEAILQLDEHWDGNGHPEGRAGEEIALSARIICLAQTFEVFHSQLGRDAAVAMAVGRSGKWFDPQLVSIVRALSPADQLWEELASESPHELVSAYEPADRVITVGEDKVTKIAKGFARVVDAKSPWTCRHSEEVSKIAVGIGEQLGLSKDELHAISIMGLVHDLGKLGVSNAVLDKPGRPTDDEFRQLQEHPRHTFNILNLTNSFGEIAHIAAAHHEKLDGSGYHRGIAKEDLPLGSQLLCVADMYEAMTAARPYREGMPREKVLGILGKEAGSLVCPDSVAALAAWLDRNEFETRVSDQLDAVDRLVSEVC